MHRARTFRDLKVYQAALDEASRLFRLALTFPRIERFALSEQMRRSSSAVSALIAEAWGRRDYPGAFRNTLTIALGEATETQAWLDHAYRRQYLTDAEYEAFDLAWQRIGGMLHSMIQKADTFKSRR